MWEVRGIRGEGEAPPAEAMSSSGTLLIIGSGRCVWSDLDAFLPRFDRDDLTIYSRLTRWASGHTRVGDVMAVNQIGCDVEAPLRHWASLHPGDLCRRLAHRRATLHYTSEHPRLHSNQAVQESGHGIEVVWRFQSVGGQSGLFATFAALCMGYGPIVLAGIPQDGTGRYYDPPDVPAASGGHGNHDIVEAWCQAAKTITSFGSVRSMSGMTAELLGKPTEEWMQCAV